MTVGETLTEARCRAGLSVDELSERTQIRSTVIRSIERDDYAACGGELYVRGYVRAIAGAIGIDAQPLIREFDEAQGGQADAAVAGGPGSPGPDATRRDLPTVTGFVTSGRDDDVDATRFDLPVVPADPDSTRLDLPLVAGTAPAAAPVPRGDPLPADATAVIGAVPDAAFPPVAPPPDPADTRFDLAPVTDDLMAAGYQLSAAPGEEWPGGPWPSAAPPAQGPLPPGDSGPAGDGRSSRPRAVAYLAVAAVAAVAIIAVAVHLAGGSPTRSAAAASVSRAASPTASAAARASAATVSPSAKPGKPAARAAVRVTHLPIAAASAFGPDGLADGDNPRIAGYTIAANPVVVWSTQWYATPDFGKLKHGTGLLLDLGGPVTVTSVRFDLTQYRGASLEIKVGNGTGPRQLRVAASASDAGGVVRLALRHPEVARYLVIWFTLLAPNGAGNYQESVSHVAVAGHR